MSTEEKLNALAKIELIKRREAIVEAVETGDGDKVREAIRRYDFWRSAIADAQPRVAGTA